MNFFALQRKRENPRRGFSLLFLSLLWSLFEKSSAKTFILKSFNAHCAFGDCGAIIDCFLGSSRAPTPTIERVILCVRRLCGGIFSFLGPSRTPVPTISIGFFVRSPVIFT